MIDPTIPNCVFRAKTGWRSQGNEDIGWYVGYVEVKNRVYYFANCIQTNDFNNQDFAIARKEIVYQILRDLKIL